ncbi:Yip1 family protein [Streptomyces sp. NPDC050560]|uniref:Yip1 family protein n=1 Tax=Streptomyces sp. NPDC050560 TaxID=3365630 RepID=UPI0037A15E58
MSQLGRNGPPVPLAPAPRSAEAGTFGYVAGFRNGRGRDNGTARGNPRQQQYGQQQPPHGGGGAPYAQQPPAGNPGPPYGAGPGAPTYPQGPHASGPGGHGHGAPHGGGYGYGGPQAQGPGGHGQWPGGPDHGEPEYFGDGGYSAPHGGPDPYAADNPGHTRQFSIGEDPYSQGETYRAGQASAPPVGPRLPWRDLLTGIVLRPAPTFLQMRDYALWAPALIVTFLYGLLAVFGFDGARDDAINATLSSAIPIVLITAVAITLSAFILGVVTHSLARQLGGDGAWQPTVGLSMLIMSLTDAPRLVVAMFLGGDQSFVRLLGWVTWAAAGALLTMMVSRSHDLPWPKALGSATIQLAALLVIVKLGTL